MFNKNILVLGHHGSGARTARVHRMPVAGETTILWDVKTIKDGGKGSHQAIVIGRLGGSVSFIGKIASDKQSLDSVQWLIDDGVDIDHLIYSEVPNNNYGITLIDDNGDNTILSMEGVRKTLTFEEVKPHILEFEGKAGIFITGFEIPVEAALSSTKLAKSLGMVTVVNPAPFKDVTNDDLSFIDILIPNESEAKLLINLNPEDKISNKELAKGVQEKFNIETVIITLGSSGSCAISSEGFISMAPIHVNAVNTIGAGDSYIGSLCLALSEGKSLRDAMQYATIVSAISVSRNGSIDSFPNNEQIEKFIKQKRIVL